MKVGPGIRWSCLSSPGEDIGLEVRFTSTFLTVKRWSPKAATAKSQPNSHRHAHGLPESGATAQAVDAHRTPHPIGCACGKPVRVYYGVQVNASERITHASILYRSTICRPR